ncbi:Hypothetical protein A7982_02851 [Minicystis rosea]|nr:Hypothetical protein A7982_02851 [Minicystis rosea]
MYAPFMAYTPHASRIVIGSLAALGGAALLCAPRTARADGGVAVSPSIMVSLSFGQKVMFGLGADLRISGLLQGRIGGCSDQSRMGIGGFAQGTWLIGASAGRFAAGFQGGGEVFEQNIAAAGELGWTYRTGLDEQHPGQHGIHLGAVGSFIPMRNPAPVVPWLDLPVRLAIPLSGVVRTPEVIPGLGIRLPAMFGPTGGGCIAGRLPRTEDGALLPGAVACGERRLRHRHLDRSTRAAIADAWIDDARAEHASITTFVALARDLASTGAPASLITRALVAAGDEVRHSALCSDLAGDLCGLDLAPLPVALPEAAAADRRDTLLRMALEAWLDGCLGEGAAADRALRAKDASTDPATRIAHGAIAVDERAHAELGWSVLAHCLAAGGSEISDALALALDTPASEPPRADPDRDADRAALRAHGRLAQHDVDASWRNVQAQARQRARGLLLTHGNHAA